MIGWKLCAVAGLLAGACNVVPSVEVTPRYAWLDVEGDFGASSGGSVASTSTDALGVEGDKGVLAPRVDASWLALDAWASWYDARFAGTGAAEGALDLGGVVIATGEPTDTEFDLLVGAAGVTYDFVPSERVDLGLGLGFGFADFDAQITSLETLQSITSRETFSLPLLAGRAAVDLGDVSLSVVAAGLALELDGDEVELFDADAALSWRFLEAGPARALLVIGYRMTRVNAEYSDQGGTVDADLAFDGPYAGLTIEL